LGVGWQDPAVIRETGVCVWKSGPKPVLEFKRNGDFLKGKMAILWTGKEHDTPGVVDTPRDFDRIALSARIAREGVLNADIKKLAEGISLYHATQLDEGMEPIPNISGSIAHKYCGGGYGGYALYLFTEESQRATALQSTPHLRPIEPFCLV
jgi:hypothetical protein